MDYKSHRKVTSGTPHAQTNLHEKGYEHTAGAIAMQSSSNYQGGMEFYPQHVQTTSSESQQLYYDLCQLTQFNAWRTVGLETYLPD